MSNVLRSSNCSVCYEQAREVLFLELISQKSNEAMLCTVLHVKVENMAVVFCLELHSKSGMIITTKVNQTNLAGFSITAD